MVNQIRCKNECKNCLKVFLYYCFNIFYDTSIMADDRINRDIQENGIILIGLPAERRELIVDSMSDIMDFDPEYNKIGKYYLTQNDSPINKNNLSNKIKNEFKYDYCRVHLFTLMKALLIIFQLYVSIIIAKSKNKKVEIKLFGEKIDAFLFLKVLYFSCFDFEKIVHNLYFSIKLEKKKFNKYLVILYQTLGHICNFFIYIIYIINTKNSNKT